MVLCLASRPRQQGSQGPPGPTGSHRVPPGPMGSHQTLHPSPYRSLPCSHTGDQDLVASWVSPLPMAGGSRSPIPTWDSGGTLSSLQQPTPVGLSGGQPVPGGCGHPMDWGLDRSQAPRAAVPNTRGTRSPRALTPPPIGLPGCSGSGSHYPLPGLVPGPRAGRGMSSSSVHRSKGALCTRGHQCPAPPATAGMGTMPVPTLPAPHRLRSAPP